MALVNDGSHRYRLYLSPTPIPPNEMSQLDTTWAMAEPYLSLLPSHRASPPIGRLLLHVSRPIVGRRLSWPGRLVRITMWYAGAEGNLLNFTTNESPAISSERQQEANTGHIQRKAENAKRDKDLSDNNRTRHVRRFTKVSVIIFVLYFVALYCLLLPLCDEIKITIGRFHYTARLKKVIRHFYVFHVRHIRKRLHFIWPSRLQDTAKTGSSWLKAQIFLSFVFCYLLTRTGIRHSLQC